MPIASLVLLMTGYKSEVSITSSLGSINSLEWLIELRDTFYLLEHWCIITDMSQKQLDGREAWGKVCRKRSGASMIYLGATLPTSKCLPTVTSLNPMSFCGGFTHRPGCQGVGLEVLTL